MVSSALKRLRRARGQVGPPRGHRRRSGGLLFGVLAVLAATVTQCTGGPITLRRIDLKVLLVNDGGVGVGAIRDELALQGVPFVEVNLNDPARPTIDAAFLSETTGTNPVIERARFQAVVTRDESVRDAAFPANVAVNPDERDAINAFEVKFGVRHVYANAWSNVNLGLNVPGYVGPLDGMTGTVTPAGQASPFNYLVGPVPFEAGSYASVATPLASPPAGTSFTPLVTVPIPGTADAGSVVGIHASGGREAMVITPSFNVLQQQFRVLGRGIVTWMTKGIHLGHNRNYLSVHVDDLYASDDRWNSELNCTPGEDCPAGTPMGTPIRMTPADVAATVAWQQDRGFTFDMVYNGFGADSVIAENGSDPLLNSTKTNVGAFRWINHTYTHAFLGCVQDYSVIPWRCQTDASGNIQYMSQAEIEQEINLNKGFATTHGLPIDTTELVTGEHSGLYILPQQPADNPNLAPALTSTGIKVTGADASRQFDARTVGSAQTLPRYPMANFFNVGTKAEMIDEYNWIFTSAADGGSGLCTANPATMTCLEPIDPVTGYDDFIVPLDTVVTLRHMLGNDPRPHYVHQSNLAEDRILLTLMDSVLTKYRSLFNGQAPFVQPTMTQASALLSQQTAWKAGQNQVEAYTLGNELYIIKGSYTGSVPITVPDGTRIESPTGAIFGEAYAGERSAWTAIPAGSTYRLVLVTAP